MADKNYTDMLDDILPFTSGCPIPVAARELKNTCIDFFRRTTAWRYDHPAITSVDDTPEYTLTPPSGAIVGLIMECPYKDDTTVTEGRDLRPKREKELRELYGDWKRAQGVPLYWTHRLTSLTQTLRLVPYPGTDDGVANAMDPVLSVYPLKSSTAIPDYLAEIYWDTLSAGALYRLLKQPDKRWTDHTQAALEFALYSRGVTQALRAVHGSYTRQAMTVIPSQPFA